MAKLVSLLIMAATCLAVTMSLPQPVKQSGPLTTVGCVRSSDCEADHCCVLGMMAYSIPNCIPMRAVNQPCRPNNKPYNTTVSYPDGATFDLYVYSSLCPCSAGLSCEEPSRGTCRDSNDLFLD